MPNAPTANAPHRLGRYFLHTRLAMGGMAEVWLARQEGPAGFTKDLVVKKILPHLAEDRQFVQMFLDEARLAARLNHPNVVQIFELGEERGVYYLVMEYIHGRNMRAIQRRMREKKQYIPYGVLIHMLVGACEGLHYAHELTDEAGEPLNLVHRDVSPDNVLVSYDGQPKVVDFGIAKAASSAGTTRTGTLKGKYAYMSPEHALGKKLDRRADIYALGVCLYELLAGMRPFRSTSELAVLNSIVHEMPPPLLSFRPDVPAGLVAIVEKAIAKSRDDRYPDARAMGMDLDAWMRANDPTSMVAVAHFLDEHFAEEKQRALAAMRAPLEIPPADAQPEGIDRSEGQPTSSERHRGKKTGFPLKAAAIGAGAGATLLAAGFLALRPWSTSAPVPVVTSPAAVSQSGPDASAPAPVAEALDAGAAANDFAAPDAGEPAAAAAPSAPDAGATPAQAGSRPPPGGKTPTPARLGKGTLVIRVNPWADVTVDGKKLGITPLPPVELTEGKHAVVLENGDLGARREASVTIKSGQATTLRVDLFD